jgi:hypothetical protein
VNKSCILALDERMRGPGGETNKMEFCTARAEFLKSPGGDVRALSTAGNAPSAISGERCFL